MAEEGGSSERLETNLSAELRRQRLRFHSESLAEPFREMWEGDVTIDVDSVVHLENGTTLQYWTVTHRDPETVLAAIAALPMTDDVTLVRSIDDRHWFEVYGAAESLFATFEAYDGVTQSATYDSEGVDVLVELPADVDTDRVVAAVQAEYDDIDLVDNYTVETLDGFRYLVSAELTERQFTVLQLTYFSGYYEQPRRRSGTELAERLDISRQGFHDHLRKAHQTVFDILFDGPDEPLEVDK